MGEKIDNLDGRDKQKILRWARRHGIKYSLTGGLSAASSASLESLCISSGFATSDLEAIFISFRGLKVRGFLVF